MFFTSFDKLKIAPVPELEAGFIPNLVTGQRLAMENSLQRFRELQFQAIASGQLEDSNFTPISAHVLASINLDIKNLNESIQYYNQIDETPSYLQARNKKICALRYIEEQLVETDTKYADSVILWLVSYQSAIYDKLISAIQQQKVYLHITSQYQKLPWDHDDSQVNLIELFSAAQAHQITGILEIFSFGKHFNINDLLSMDLPDALRNKLKGSLEFLGGGNSLCFTIVDEHSNETMVLKAENFLKRPKLTERDLRRKLQIMPNMHDFIPPNFFEMRARYFHPKYGHTMGRLILTSYCNQGSIRNYLAKNEKKFSEHPQFVLELMLSLAKRIQGLKQCGYANTDLKLDNILVHVDPVSQKITLHVSDCKAFYKCNDRGFLIQSDNRIIATSYYSAPETRRACLVDEEGWYGEALEVYTLGKNLYECMLYHSNDMVQRYRTQMKNCYEFGSVYFEDAIFKWTNEGPEIKALIQDMVKIDPKQRISLEEVINRLVMIRCSSQRQMHKYCLEQLEILKTYQFVYNPDTKHFITEITKLLTQPSYLDLRTIHARIQQKLTPLLCNERINRLKSSLYNCHEQYERIKAMDDHWLEQSFYRERDEEFASLDRGEEYDYPVGLICMEDYLCEGQAYVMRHLWRQRRQIKLMLDKILMYRFGQSDQAILQYVCDKDRLLSLSIRDARTINHLYQEIKQMLECLESPELEKIRQTIQQGDIKSKPPRRCGIEYFFSYKRKVYVADGDDAKNLEEKMAKLSLEERKNMCHPCETGDIDQKLMHLGRRNFG